MVIGGADGRILLYNFMTSRLLHEFKGVASSAIKCIQSSPALDVVGVGDADGCALNAQKCAAGNTAFT